MKKMTVGFIAVLLTGLFITSCKDDEVEPTSLEITVSDDLGTPVAGATAKLFSSQTDWDNETNQVGSSQISDSKGIIRFTNLTPIKYYWRIEKDCKNNVFGSVTTTNPLPLNQKTITTASLSPTGTLRFVNNSNNPYDIFLNGLIKGSVEGNSTGEIKHASTGSYSIRVLQKSGYTIYPTDKTYTGTLTCGATLTTTFPN